MRSKSIEKDPIAVFCSDLHLTSRCPKCRNPETWITDQQDMLMKIVSTCIKHECSLCIAGDIFHRAKEDPIIESIAIRELSKLKGACYTIPGQHDLPGHSYQRIGESSYGVLMETKYVYNCPRFVPLAGSQAYLYGIPYGEEIPVLSKPYHNMILMAHQMVFVNKPFPDAPESGNVKALYKKLNHFKVAVFGDNHQGFVHKKKDKSIINCGVGIQRTISEIDYTPYCYLLYSDMSVEKIALPVTKDILVTQKDSINEQFDVFVQTLQEKQEVSLSFRDNLKQTLDKVKASTRLRELIWEIMEESND